MVIEYLWILGYYHDTYGHRSAFYAGGPYLRPAPLVFQS
jgi:hypothetical protein